MSVSSILPSPPLPLSPSPPLPLSPSPPLPGILCGFGACTGFSLGPLLNAVIDINPRSVSHMTNCPLNGKTTFIEAQRVNTHISFSFLKLMKCIYMYLCMYYVQVLHSVLSQLHTHTHTHAHTLTHTHTRTHILTHTHINKQYYSNSVLGLMCHICQPEPRCSLC